MSRLLFSTFEVTNQSIYRATQSFAIVNLKPIVPGRKYSKPPPHINFTVTFSDVLVIPTKPVPRLADLDGID